MPGRGDADYQKLIEKDCIPAFETFRPEVILASAGFDAHARDDMSDMKLSTEGFSWIMKQMLDMAHAYSKGRIISVLEGGYAIRSLPELIENHVKLLMEYE